MYGLAGDILTLTYAMARLLEDVAAGDDGPGVNIIHPWRMIDMDSSDLAAPSHMMPVDDAMAHETAQDCPCGPTVENYLDQGVTGTVFHHHALDGRG